MPKVSNPKILGSLSVATARAHTGQKVAPADNFMGGPD
jgi:hypothetical protein